MMKTNLGSEDIVEWVYRSSTMRLWGVEVFGEDSRMDWLGLYRAQDEGRE